jgi:lantibiotic modifying enzyme
MSLTTADIDEIVRAVDPNSSKRSRRGRELREFLAILGDLRFGPRRAPPLIMLCGAGVDHAWGRLEKEAKADLLAQLSARAKASLKRHLQKILETITRPTFELEWTSFTLALSSLGFPGNEHSALAIEMFLRQRPAHRLGQLFKSFPVLADLWALAMRQWRSEALEILVRLRKDRAAISRLFSDPVPNEKIKNLRLRLSDPHGGARSVALIEFGGNHRVIYKPRSGRSELAWFTFLEWINRQGFRPALRTMRLLVRQDYCWMEYAEAAPCATPGAVRRFYERLGGLIAAAYLLKTVDCHRENLIAAGEHPVLVDVDALWHVSPVTSTQSMSHVLYRTGFFPNARGRSLQSRSSVLGHASRGTHLPRIGDQVVAPGPFADEIISGFRKAWATVLGRRKSRAAFNARLGQIRARERRWIYCATARYVAILRASLGPAVLRSGAERDALIRRFCSRAGVNRTVGRAEMKALRELSIPYFNRRTRRQMPPDPDGPPSELIEAIRDALRWSEK